MGVEAGVVEKTGAWFTYNGNRLGQGRENAKEFLSEHPEVVQEIEDMIRTSADGCTPSADEESVAETAA
jgi:recombination protein RecA